MENVNIFGKFQGFTLKPLPSPGANNFNASNVAFVHPVSKISSNVNDLDSVPSRTAPPLPVPPHGAKVQPTTQKHVAFSNIVKTSTAPALPPLNPGSTARLLISNPVLQNSTSDVVPNGIPNGGVPNAMPIRKAPGLPILNNHVGYEEPLVPDILINPTGKEKEKKQKDGTLSRIQSFLKKDTHKEPEAPKPVKQIKTIDREKLKDIEISNPILQASSKSLEAIDADNKKKQATINRVQSMRDPQQNAPLKHTANNLASFGSMRNNRPKSIVDRPTIPPPPRPPAHPPITGWKIPGVAGYQNPPEPKRAPIANNEYDDCENHDSSSSQSPDNIYSVIEESHLPSSPNLLSPPVTSQTGSIESMGLLNEIVSEIEHRNFDAIYIASTLKRNKSKDSDQGPPTYANASPEKIEEEYNSNTNVDSAASTTSSGYLRPSAINTPIARIPPSKTITKMPSSSSNSFSSFKSANSTVNSPKESDNNAPLKKSNSDLNKNKLNVNISKSDPDNGYKAPVNNRPVNEEKSDLNTRRPSLKKIAPNTTSSSITKPQNSLRTRSPSPKQVPKATAPNKPKTPLKPATVNKPITPSTFGANKNDKSKLKSTTAPTNKVITPATSNSISKINNKTSPDEQQTSTSQNASSNSSKMLNQAAKPKVSNVASLQQKFEANKASK